MDAFGPLVSTAWLGDHLGDPSVRVIDVRWYLDPERNGRAAYAAGHIPGALFLDIDEDLAAPGGKRGGALGRHPWPEATQVERVMSAVGIDASMTVVAYDDQSGAIAARLWYVLRSYGHDAVAVLDGGIVKWVAEAREVSSSAPIVAPRPFGARRDSYAVVTKHEVVARGNETLLIDARAPERYRGESEPIDPVAGHIPGAVNVPYASNLTSDPVPVMKPREELRAIYSRVGADARPTIAYCGSGITSCHTLLALAAAGLSGRLYAGSWSEWSSDPARAVETGDPHAPLRST